MSCHLFKRATAIAALAVLALVTGCSAISSSDSDSGNSTSKLNADGTVTLSLNLKDSVLSRSIIPDTSAGSLYFTVVATNNAGGWSSGAQAADGAATDIVYWRNESSGSPITGVPTGTVTLNLRADEYWRITAYGTEAAGNAIVADSTMTEKTAAITELKSKAVVDGSISFYISSAGAIYKINENLASSPESYDPLVVTTKPDTAAGTGTISLPIKTTSASKIGYIKIVYSGRGSPAPTHADTAVTFTAADTTTTIDGKSTGDSGDTNKSFTPGLYDVYITMASSANAGDDIYSYHETLTVWANKTSTWSNTVSGMYAGTESSLYLDVTDAKVAAYKRTIFYVSATTNDGTGGHLPAGSTTDGNGSIFKPFATVQQAIDKCSASDSTTWNILVDGTATSTATSGYGTNIAGSDSTAFTVNISSFPNTTATIADGTGTDASLYVGGSKTVVTLQNIAVTGKAVIATPGFIMDNCQISGTATIKADTDYITVDLDDTTSSVGGIVLGYTAEYNKTIIKNKDDALTETWLHPATVRFALDSTWAADNSAYVLAVDKDTDNTATVGSVILKKPAAFTVASSGTGYTITASPETLTVTLNASADAAVNTDTVTVSVKDSTNTETTDSISNVAGLLYDNAETALTLTPSATDSKTFTFSVPAYVQKVAGTYTLRITFEYNNELFGGNITLTVQ